MDFVLGSWFIKKLLGIIVLGSPGKVIRQVTDKKVEEIKENATHYVENYKRYKK